MEMSFVSVLGAGDVKGTEEEVERKDREIELKSQTNHITYDG